MKTKSLLLALLTVISWAIQAQDLSQYKKEVFSERGQHLNYRILYPEHFSPNKKYPVVLFLHGSGERGNDNEAQLVHGSKLFLKDEVRKDFPAVVIFPQCPKEDYWSSADIDRSQYPLGIIFPEKKATTPAMQLVLDLMDSIKAEKYSDDSRIYVGGLSMGGMGTFEILRLKPDMFAAAFPICGGANPAVVSQYDPKLSIWVFHGAKDNVVLPSYSTDMVIALMKAKMDVKYTLYKDANHNSWDSAFAEPQLLPWLFSKSKSVK